MFEIILRSFIFRLLDLEHLRHFWDYWGLFFLGKTSPLALYLTGLLSGFFKRCCVWFLNPVGLLLYIGFQKWSSLCFTLQRVTRVIMTYVPLCGLCVCVITANTYTHTHTQRAEASAGFLSLSVCHMSWRVSYVWAAVAQLSTEMSFKHWRFMTKVKLLLVVP